MDAGQVANKRVLQHAIEVHVAYLSSSYIILVRSLSLLTY